jgi:hypothetical protein
MSKISKKNAIAVAVVGALALTTGAAHADKLNTLHKEQAKTQYSAVKSQSKVDSIFEQTQELLGEYRRVVDETEERTVYNDHLEGLVSDQQAEIDSLQEQIDSIEDTKRGVVPLMYRMIDTLEQFIELDVPINIVERRARVERLRSVMTRANVSVSEQFRLVLEAYEIENSYGATIRSHQSEIDVNGTTVVVDKFNLGRVALMALSLDQKSAWRWNNESRQWDSLGDQYVSSVVQAVRMGQKIATPDLVKLPIVAASE